MPPERFRSHSLRIGGATALYHKFKDIEIVKRMGRWKSSAFQGYLWSAEEDSKGLAQQMAADRTTIHVGQSQQRLKGTQPSRVRFAPNS